MRGRDVVPMPESVGIDQGQVAAWRNEEHDSRTRKVTRVDPETWFFRMEASKY